MVAQVEAHLEQNPDDGRGWEVVAPVYMRMGCFNDAVRARANTVRLLGATADREADLGEAMAAAGNSIVTADAKASSERALKIDPDHLKAQYFVGLAAELGPADGRRCPDLAGHAGTRPGQCTVPPAGRAIAGPRRQERGAKGIAVEPRAPQPGPTPRGHGSRPAIDAGAAQPDGAGHGRPAGGTVENRRRGFRWLVAAGTRYVVMGDAAKARGALADARNAVGNDDDKRKRLDDLAKSLGIDG